MDPPECSGHSHDHDHEDGLGTSLRPHIDLPKVFCLNEEVENSGRAVLKLHEERLSVNPSLRSPDDDAELLLVIPFTEAVTLRALCIRSVGSEDTSSPRRIKIFPNRDDLDFDSAREMPAPMELELLPPHHFAEGTIDYPCRPAGRFQNIASVTIFVQDNYDEDLATEITYVGLKGKGTNMKRLAVDCVYESQGMAEDHKVPGGELGGRNLI